MNNLSRRVCSAAAALALSTVLAACGGDAGTSQGTDTASSASPSSAASAQFNKADVQFASDMIVHHRGAIDMAELAGDRAAMPEVKSLAAQIKKAQQPEIDTMSGWLQSWGEDVPAADDGGMHHDAGHAADMPGMMTEQETTALTDARGAAFDRMFLEMMIKHHEGAIDMSEGEQLEGDNAEAIALAKKIVADQRAEIATMQDLLKRV